MQHSLKCERIIFKMKTDTVVSKSDFVVVFISQ